MRDILQAADRDEDRPVLPWRLTVGVLLHLIIPAYVVAIIGAAIAAPPAHDSEAVLAFLLRSSAVFLGAYALLTAAVALGTALLDPSLRRRRARLEASDPAALARRSQRRVARATERASVLAFGDSTARVTAAVAAIRAGRWHHGDDRFQALSADLDEATRAFSVALDTARAGRRGEVAGMAAATLERIAQALETLAAERARLDEGDAHTVARYIEARYGAPDPLGDFAGSVD